MKKIFATTAMLAVILAIGLTTGCTGSEEPATQKPGDKDPGVPTRVTFKVGPKAMTRAYHEHDYADGAGQYVKWEVGDEIYVGMKVIIECSGGGNGSNYYSDKLFVVESVGNDGLTAEVAGTLSLPTEKVKSISIDVCNAYHYTGERKFYREVNCNIIYCDMPETQNYRPDGFSGIPLVARCEGGLLEDMRLEFGTLLSILRIPVRKEAGVDEIVKLRGVQFKGNNDEGITGNITYRPTNEIIFNNNSGTRTVDLSFGTEELVLTEEVQYIHLGILPIDYTDGVTFTFMTGDGIIFKTARFPETTTLAGNTIYTIPEVVIGIADPVSIPDENFRAWLLDPTNGGPYIDVEEGTGKITLLPSATTLTKMNLYNANISSLEGIEYFKNMDILWCNGNANLLSLDLFGNPALTQLDCSYTGLTSLDVSQNEELQIIHCQYNTEQTLLDVSKNAELVILNCHNTGITELDVSGCPELEVLTFGGLQITTDLNISGCNELAYIESINGGVIMNNQLTTKAITISGNERIGNFVAKDLDNPNIKGLKVSGNDHIVSVDVAGSVFTNNVELTNNPNLKSVNLTGTTINGLFTESGNHQDIEVTGL